eukprot:394137_1
MSRSCRIRYYYTYIITAILINSINSSPTNPYEPILAAHSCFAAKYFDQSTIFSPPKNGTIFGIRLTHLNGSVKCSNNGPFTNWGCEHDGGTPNIFTVFLRVTNSANFVGILYYPTEETQNITMNYPTVHSSGGTWDTCSHGCTVGNYQLPSFDAHSSNITLMNPIYEVHVNEKFMLQYCTGCCPEVKNSGGSTFVTYGNAGSACAAVYFLYDIPTVSPTIEPTINPTLIPTMIPTINPTTYPTTDTPTTMHPSSAPLKDGQQIDTTLKLVTETPKESIEGQSNMFDSLIIVIMVTILCVFVCCIGLLVILNRKKKMSQQQANVIRIAQITDGDNITNIQLSNIVKSDTVKSDIIENKNDESQHSGDDDLYTKPINATVGEMNDLDDNVIENENSQSIDGLFTGTNQTNVTTRGAENDMNTDNEEQSESNNDALYIKSVLETTPQTVQTKTDGLM